MKQAPTKHSQKGRRRAKPIQIYLSPDELTKLERLEKRRGCSRSELVRGWIERADTAVQAADRARARETAPPPDPRQLKIAGA